MRTIVRGPSPRRLALILCAVVLALTLLSLFTAFVKQTSGSTLGFRLFNLNEEANLPTWFSSITLLFSSILAWLIARSIKQAQRPYSKSWYLLGCGLFLMSIDEFAQIHEGYGRFLKRIDLFRDFGFGDSLWLIMGLSFVAVIALILVKMWWHLPYYFKLVFLYSGIVYFGGSAMMETVGNEYAKQMGWESLGFLIFMHIEEVLEMTGVVILIFGLLKYLATLTDEICFEISTSKS
jgi:hypothetical protein